MKITLITALILISQITTATEYFISPQGDDNNSGTLNSPWKSLSHGFNQVQDGDTLTLRGGVYRLIEETDLNTINTPNLTLQSYSDETVDILGSYGTANDTWEIYDANIWRISAEVLSSDPKGMFNGHTRVDHQSDLDGGRDHDHVSNLVEPNHWTKADINGTQCFADNAGCYIYLYPAIGEVPNNEVYELSQRSLGRVAANGHHMVVRNLNFYYTQSAPIFFEGADFITLENNSFGHTSNGNDNSYAVRIWDSKGSVVRNNRVFDSVYWGGTSNSKGISFMVTKPGEPNIVEYNEIYDIPGRSAVGTKGGTSNLIVRYNYIHDVFMAFEPGSFRCVWSSSNNDGCQETDEEYRPAGDWKIYGNIVVRSEIGLWLPTYNADNDNNLLYNNVFYDVKSGVQIGWDDTFGTVISNNIFVNNEVGIYLYSGGTTTTVDDYLDQFVSHHNLYFNNSHADIHLRPNWGGNFYSGTPYDLASFSSQFSGREYNSLNADPEFTNTVDFELMESSPAVAVGDGSLWNLPSVDIGAYPLGSSPDLIFKHGFDD
ncbi:right-handed parallel beta-helix repeat-containing protein [Marinicella rhabdoformis]|uniref:right-handed parallel beta-helix repeat-containing protein n=1 Tax=Marinicella rhabdoformis TaxID=2580566 RepID=UPI0015D0B130|nr:right-handed parallel beta-helix repeat-containing protein [Marinicella rhabdoformis]